MAFVKIYNAGRAKYHGKIAITKDGKLIIPRALTPHYSFVELLIDEDEKLMALRFEADKKDGNYKLSKLSVGTVSVNLTSIMKKYEMNLGKQLVTAYNNDLENQWTVFSYAPLLENGETGFKPANTKPKKGNK